MLKYDDISVARTQSIFEIGYPRAARLSDILLDLGLVKVSENQKRIYDKSRLNEIKQFIFNYMKDDYIVNKNNMVYTEETSDSQEDVKDLSDLDLDELMDILDEDE